MATAHTMLMRDLGGRLYRKQRAMTAMKVAKEGLGPSFDEARQALRDIPSRESDFVGKHEARFAAVDAAKRLLGDIRTAQDAA